MAKIQIKYLTKPSKEAIAHIEKFKNKMSEDEIRKFLEESNHFCLLIYSFGKLSSLVFLENDAMIKAQYIAKEYMQEQAVATEEEVNKIFEGFQNLNKGLIKGTNCNLFTGIMIKLAIFNTLALIF